MIKTLYRSMVATVLFAILLCGVYPLVVWGLGGLFFSNQTTGQLMKAPDGHLIGSKLIGQVFTKPEYFHGRPSSAGTGYDASNSSGSNLGPTHQKFADGLKANVDALLKDNPTLKKGDIPVDLVTSSGSGLDPHISPEGASVQIARIARARGISESDLKSFVSEHIEGPEFGIFGEPVVNVLVANFDLDRKFLKH